MAELTFKSPGISTREIDLTGPTKLAPSGVPAGIVGTSVRGPAFVPITFATWKDFVSTFGSTDGKKFGPLAVDEWMKNSTAGTYVKVLGVGNGKARITSGDNTGKVTNAGFVVGNRLPQANGVLGDNVFANDTLTPTSPKGQTYFLGCFMSQSAGSTIFSDAGIQEGVAAAAEATVTFTGTSSLDETLTIVDTAGTSIVYQAINTQDLLSNPPRFGRNGTPTEIAASLAACLADDNGHNGTITTSLDAGEITLTQTVFGGDGNTTIDDSGLGNVTVVQWSGGTLGNSGAQPILRAVLMVPSGVVPALSSSFVGCTNNTPSITNTASGTFGADFDAGSSFGDVITSNQLFTMYLNGHKASDSYGHRLTASFDTNSPSFLGKVLNKDPQKLDEAGHYLYTHWDVSSQHAEITSNGMNPAPATRADRATLGFLLNSSLARNSGSAKNTTNVGTPNWENWEDRFSTPSSPMVISQQFGGKNTSLFKVHALDDGAYASSAFKITVENIQASTNENNKFGTFDLLIRVLTDNDMNPVAKESFRKLSLDPSSDRYITKVVGDTHTFYDFDKKAGGQKLVISGKYPNNSQFVRIETTSDLDLGRVDDTALPVGFRGVNHLVLSGTTVDSKSVLTGSTPGDSEVDWTDYLKRMSQVPLPFRENISRGVGQLKTVEPSYTWGMQFELNDSLTEPNKNQLIDPGVYGFLKHFPNHQTTWQNSWVGGNEGTPDLAGCVLDADRYNNNIFTLERVEIITSSNDKPEASQWVAAKYRRNGSAAGTLTDRDDVAGIGSRFLNVSKDFTHLPSRKFLKFTFPLQGGFDGVNVFNKDKATLTDTAVRREMADTNQGKTAGPTVAAYRKAVDVMEEKSDVDIQLLAIPGLRHEAVTDYALESTERRFDALYIMDIEEKDKYNTYITESNQKVNSSFTADRLASRALDSSFAAAYFPDVVITDPTTNTNVQCPPSVAVIGAFALNDSLAHPWFAPAGFTRGSLKSVIESQVKLSRTNLDELYTVDINPITSFPHTPGVVIFGQKTLLAAQSALDRVNVRRLLIDVRRKVKAVANTLLFQPNKAETLSKFSAQVTPILTKIQQQQGVDRFKVQIDTSTTTQADVENNTIRGKIFLQPTRSVEFISLDFVVTNAGSGI